jgi:hypothetical protein
MRSTLLSLGLTALTVTLVPHVAAAFPDHTVYLDGQADLDRLRATNPSHYARAERIMAAANELCRPTEGEISYARFEARDISCSEMLLRTSNPPKRQIAFTLDDTRYIALVVLTDDRPRVVPATR